MIELVKSRVIKCLDQPQASNGQLLSPLSGMTLLRHYKPTSAESFVYNPLVCLVLQGEKEATFAGHTVLVGAGSMLLISHDLPVTARITRAPYIALIFDIELAMLRSIYDDAGDDISVDSKMVSAFQVNEAHDLLLDALSRYLLLAEAPLDARILGEQVRREICYRLLVAPVGSMLRSLLRRESPSSAIAQAIASLQRSFRSPIVVADLAREVGMSVSSLHKHFKAVTSWSPLQYQKELRLLEARRMLVAGGSSVTSIAYEIGYESPTQFSREYARRFGHAPSLDLFARQASAPQ
jgi:AraC-like DNA-binding protein